MQTSALKLSNKNELNLWPQTYIAGAVAGIVTSVTAPVEQLRILSQSNTKSASNSLLSTVKKIRINAERGFTNGIYRGFTVTLLRETQAYGVWFLAYESLISYIQSSRGYKSRNDISTVELLTAGAFADAFLALVVSN